MDNPAVEIRGLTHIYDTRHALDGIDLDVSCGQLFALLGPNGGGKTTLFRILATLMIPTAGRAGVLSLDVVDDAAAVRRRIGVVFQSPSLDKKLTVSENLLHHGRLHGMTGRTLRERRDEMLARFGVADRARDRVETLSGGLARRVELARGMLHRPELLLLDEPSTGLDPAARRALSDQLRALCDEQNVTVIVTTHITDEADRADRLAILDTGKIVVDGTPERLKEEIGGDCVSVTAHDPNTLAGRIRERFGSPVTVVAGRIRIERERGHELVTQVVEAFPGQIDSITVSKPTLEDVFIHHTGRRFWGHPPEAHAE